MNDYICIKGTFLLKRYEDNVLVEEFEDNNLVVFTGSASMAQLLAGNDNTKKVAKIGIGTNPANPVPGDTALTGSFTKNLVGFTFPNPNQAKFQYQILEAEGVGIVVQEFGLISQDNTLFARRVKAPFTKTSSTRLEGFWTITF